MVDYLTERDWQMDQRRIEGKIDRRLNPSGFLVESAAPFDLRQTGRTDRVLLISTSFTPA